MAQCDGLIGDYSSASMQYLLMDRPQAFVVPDIKEYGERRGFVFKNIEEYMGGHIIKSKMIFGVFLLILLLIKTYIRRNVIKYVTWYINIRMQIVVSV